jgi:hypothetical protein
MNYFLIISCVVSGWAILRLMGAERTQMVKSMESEMRRQQLQQKPPAPVAAAPAAGSASAKGGKAAPAKAAPAPKSKH